jgi:hypothetical protein
MQTPQNPYSDRSENYGQCLDREIVHLAMPAWYEVLACFEERRECDG